MASTSMHRQVCRSYRHTVDTCEVERSGFIGQLPVRQPQQLVSQGPALRMWCESMD